MDKCSIENCEKSVLVRGKKKYCRCEQHQREFWSQYWRERETRRRPEKAPVPDGYKRCAHCGEVFAATLEYFGKAGAKLNSYCRPCHASRQRQYQNAETVIPEFKTCAQCNETKPAAEFTRKGKRLGSYCLRCHSIRNTKQKQAQPPKLIVVDKASGVFRRVCSGIVVDELPLSSFRRGEPRADTLRILQYAGYKLEVRG